MDEAGESGDSSPRAVPGGDAGLITATEAGDAAAYVTLHERHMAAARNLASNLVKDPAEAEEVLSETFARLHSVLRRGDGPDEALRPYLLAAVRRVAYERRNAERAGTQAGQKEVADPGEPLFTDAAATELASAPLARAFMSLPERQRAVLWHTVIEQGDPAEAATLLGLTAGGVAELGEQARAAFNRAYLTLHASGLTREECKAEAGKLGLHLDGATRGPDEAMVQRHLRGCRNCRAAVIDLTGLSRSLRRAVAPIFLGSATAAYLEAAEAKPAQPGPAIPGLAWLSRAPRWMRQAPRQAGQAPRRIRRAPRQQQVLAGGVVLVAAFAVTGLTLTLAANGSPQHTAQHPVPAAIAPPSPAAPAASSSPAQAPARTAATTRPGKPAASPSPAPARSSSPAPASPAPASPAPTSPAPTSPAPASPSPAPAPAPSPPHRRHRHPPGP
jgi:RNA polymerase sigma factor (sigma-70 family)